MEINKTQIDIKAFGKDIKISPPSAMKVAKYKKSMDGIKDDEILVEKSIEFLISCGMEKETCDELELHHIVKLIELISVKKN